MTEADDWHSSQAAAWVLGALPPEEAERFAEHLPNCEKCVPLVQRLRDIVDVLPGSVREEVPPQALRSRIMSAVEAEADLFRAAEEDGPDPGPLAVRRRTPSRWLVSVVALGLVAVGAFVGGTLTSKNRVMQVPAGRTVTGSVTDSGGGPRAQAAVVERNATAELVLTDLAAPPEGKIYQAWVIRRRSAPIPTGTLFSVPRSGDTKVSLPDLDHVERVIVSAEPPRGSRSPTPPPVVVVLLGR